MKDLLNLKTLCRVVAAAFFIAVCVSFSTFENSCEELRGDVLRIHIIANSDSAADQSLKLSVRDAVLSALSPLFCGASSKSEEEQITRENLRRAQETAQAAVRESGFDYDVKAELKNTFFDTRYYDNFTMPAGYYDALTVTIGDGKGQNFWCVLYPALCVGAGTKEEMKENLSEDEYGVITAENVEYRFKVVEYYQKIRDFFS